MHNSIWHVSGIYIINLKKTWEKLLFAARAIAAIENPADICVISARPYGQRAVLKFASYTGATPIAGRFTPGTFTNQIQVSVPLLTLALSVALIWSTFWLLKCWSCGHFKNQLIHFYFNNTSDVCHLTSRRVASQHFVLQHKLLCELIPLHV